ncbi:Chromodomain-helicase-DNA-binding protein 8 [Carpediemonas membranifera]|uniref:Chromodomain-helicase-DNA-binding protein 8 n=1 Tax=Carpediemonas membranifera TaxID=201153 RepID=A0A8J6E1A5_9EUKA|nr:Chromodomain-helicase-DNA-binding protein 8 [Carpediemonas membranifera]|eukprot:KAG9390382.1 Chromodomain-helicase-DNA-binding protein 8 [Carpediemonas membranifera]
MSTPHFSIVRRRPILSKYEFEYEVLFDDHEVKWVSREEFNDDEALALFGKYDEWIESKQHKRPQRTAHVQPNAELSPLPPSNPSPCSVFVQNTAVDAVQDDDVCYYCLGPATETCRECKRGFCSSCVDNLTDVYHCIDCDRDHHQCAAPICGQSGPVSLRAGLGDNDGGLIRCSFGDGSCGVWYHKHCLDIVTAVNLSRNPTRPGITTAGDTFICPSHVCTQCHQPIEEREQPFAVTCIRCRSVWHVSCGYTPLLRGSARYCLCEECERSLPNGGRITPPKRER